MMEDICAHIVDIVANSVSAEASLITITVRQDRSIDLLAIQVVDDGRGMDQRTAALVVDPFYSSKLGKKVGLGVPLLKMTAEMCGGNFSLTSEPGRGTEIGATFLLSHPDLPPLGNVKETFLLMVVANPDVDFVLRYEKEGKRSLLDTRELRAELAGVPINHPLVIKYLANSLDETIQNL